MSEKFQFENQGLNFECIVSPDDYCSMPWKENDGHGEMREIYSPYVRPDKKPGERIIYSDGRTYWVYDVAASIAIAKRDAWGCDEVTPGMSTGQGAAVSVESDIRYIVDWLNGDRFYVRIEVYQIDRDGEKRGDSEYLGGIDSGYSRASDAYRKDCANDLASEIVYEKRKAWRAAMKDCRARHYWVSRDIITA